jgi:hypothetical protein
MWQARCQAAKLNFAAVALTTAVKVKVLYLFNITITKHLSAYLRCNLTKSGLVTVKFDFVSGRATISTEFSSGLKFPPISNETAA